MSEDEFKALLKLEGKELKIGKADGQNYMASVIVGQNTVYNYAYGKNKKDALDKLIRRYYANN